ncbi:MAG TPA: hypothetical protein VHC49_15935 [Mycobacteriales bacterium]|nr:hypothetical protein [Mycobacteriales bacterium]
MTCCPPADTDAAFAVTINPEGRVEVARTDVPVEVLQPGVWASIPVAVINQGYVTGALQVRWSPLPGVEVEAPDTPLSGESLQETEFRVRLAEPGGADLTVRFWALGALGGLANKNTSYLYLRCQAVEAVAAG